MSCFIVACSWLKWTRKPNNGYAKQGQVGLFAFSINANDPCIACMYVCHSLIDWQLIFLSNALRKLTSGCYSTDR
jgi:hypothetical protein